MQIVGKIGKIQLGYIQIKNHMYATLNYLSTKNVIYTLRHVDTISKQSYRSTLSQNKNLDTQMIC